MADLELFLGATAAVVLVAAVHAIAVWLYVHRRQVTTGQLVHTTTYDNVGADVGSITDSDGVQQRAMFTTDVVEVGGDDDRGRRYHYVQSFEYEVRDETYMVSHYTMLERELQSTVVVYYDPEHPENATTLAKLKRPFYFYASLLGGLLLAYGLLYLRSNPES